MIKAVWVDENWRLTFTFEAKDAVLVDYQDYHCGRPWRRACTTPRTPGKYSRTRSCRIAGFRLTEFARKLGVSRVALSRVINGRAAVSADMALRFAAALGGSAESWLQMQATYDLWQAAKKPRPRVLPLKLAA